MHNARAALNDVLRAGSNMLENMDIQIESFIQKPKSAIALKDIDVADYARRLESFASEFLAHAYILRHTLPDVVTRKEDENGK